MKKLFTLLILLTMTSLVWSQDHTVLTVGNTAYNPTNLVITLGETVEWVNTGGSHNVNGTQTTYPDNPESFGNAVGPGWTFQHTFNTLGFYNYQCDPHVGLGMIGTITVVGPAYPIGLVTGDSDGNGEADSVNVACTLTGTVYGVDIDGNAGLSFTIIDAAGDGINVFNFDDVSNYVVTEGDEVIISGVVGSFNGLAQIVPDGIVVSSSNNALMPATVVTALNESTESQLVRLEGVSLAVPSQWTGGGSSFNVDVTDGTNTWVVRIDGDVDLSTAAAPVGLFNITGIGGQFDNSAPYTDGYQMLPRYAADIETLGGGTPSLMITGVVDPQGGNGSGGNTAGAKAVELYALQDIPDLSVYGIGAANNGGGSDGVEFTFPADAISAGTCILVTDSSNVTNFLNFFGVDASYLVASGGTSATGINGDDAVELFENGVLVDVFGDINVDGSGEAWEYTDGWAYRSNGATPNGGTFNASNWVYSGVDALQDNNIMTNAGFSNPFPNCTFSPVGANDISAVNDVVTLPIDVASNIDILANDATPNGVTSIMIIAAPANGMATVNGTTDITYTPTAGFCGADAITYEICDATACSQASVAITVECPISYPNMDIGALVIDNDGNGVSDVLGTTATITGVVYGVDLRGGGGLSFTVIGSDGEGINVFNFDDVDNYAVVEGDEITLQGEVIQFNGLTEFEPITIVLNSTGNALVTPTDVTSLGEDTESQLVRMVNMFLADPTQWDGTGGSFNVDITNGGIDTFTMRIDSDVADVANWTGPTGVFNVTGIGGQFDPSDPYTEGYQLFPRYLPDFEEIIATVNPELAQKIKLQPNPVSDVLQINSEIQLDNIRVTNMLGQQVAELRSPNLNESLNVNNWQSGVYVITFMTNDQIWATQFVKQ